VFPPTAPTRVGGPTADNGAWTPASASPDRRRPAAAAPIPAPCDWSGAGGGGIDRGRGEARRAARDRGPRLGDARRRRRRPRLRPAMPCRSRRADGRWCRRSAPRAGVCVLEKPRSTSRFAAPGARLLQEAGGPQEPADSPRSTRRGRRDDGLDARRSATAEGGEEERASRRRARLRRVKRAAARGTLLLGVAVLVRWPFAAREPVYPSRPPTGRRTRAGPGADAGANAAHFYAAAVDVLPERLYQFDPDRALRKKRAPPSPTPASRWRYCAPASATATRASAPAGPRAPLKGWTPPCPTSWRSGRWRGCWWPTPV
jgi:hypothetical protein